MPRRPAPEPAAPRRRRRWLLIAAAGLVAATLAGPTLLSFTPIPLSFIASALPPEAGRLGARSASLSWFGPIAVGGIELRDPQGAVIFVADRVELAGGLLGLTGGKSAALNVRVENPRVDLAVGPGGTNFDALIQSLQKKDAANPTDPHSQSPSAQRPLNVQVTGAAARVTDTTTGAQWVVDEVNLDLVDPAQGIDAIELTATGKLSAVSAPGAAAPPRGEFSVRLGQAAEGGRLARVQAKAVPLSLVDPFLKRADPTAAVTGWISLDGDAAWQPKPGTLASSTRPADVVRALTIGNVRSAGALQLRDVEFRGAATQGGPVRLASIDGPWRLAAAGEGIAIQQLDLTSEVGSVALVGSVTPDEADRWANGVAMAPRDLRLASRVDLQRLAAVAPQLVRLQQGARVDSGRVEVTATCKEGLVAARLATGELAGVAGGRRVEWREPLDVQIAARQEVPTAGAAGWALESFKAASTFFQAEASGDATRLEGKAEFDLDRLAKELAPLVDLGDTRLAGAGNANFAIDRNEATRRWRLEGRGAVKDLFVGTQAAPLAQEPALNVTAKLVGSLDSLAASPVGAIDLTAGDDVLVVTLPDGAGAAARPFEVRLTGDAARWLRRAAVASPQIPSPESIGLAGAVAFTATGKAGAPGGALDQFTLSLTGLALDTASLSGPRLRLQNERVEASGVAAWDNRTREVQVASGQVITSVASASLRDVLLSMANPAASRGEAAFKVDLTRLDGWMPPREGPARYAASGLLEGTTRLRGVPEGLQVLVNAKGQRLTLVDRNPPAAAGSAPAGPQPIWAEPQMALDADVMVTPLAAQGAQLASYAVDIRDARLQSQSLNGSFGGRIADLVAMRGVEMGGGIDYDLEKLTPMLWPHVGDGVRLVGRDRLTFRIATDETAPANAAAVARLKASFEAPWQSADLYGLPVGSGRLVATLERGVVQVAPLDVAIGDGRLTATAAATLDPSPGMMTLKPGPLVTNVAISQQVSDRLLKFIAPVLADATRSEGKFSITLSEFAIPLSQPASGPPQGRAVGVLGIQQVRVLPSPAVAEWLAMAKQIANMAKDGVTVAPQASDSPLVTIDNCQVEFQMIDGRVYHRGLQFAVGDALVQSSGSVGVDETLDLVIAIPILDEWVDKRPTYLGRMRGQAIRIPVQGTLSRPKINRDALTQLSSQLLESAAAGALEGGINKLLEKLKTR
jgi:translocation and assembly module TamB